MATDPQDPNAADTQDDDRTVPQDDSNEAPQQPTKEESDEATLAEQGFPDDWTAEDLEGLSDAERASIIADQEAARPKQEDPAPEPDPEPQPEPEQPKPEYDVETAQATLTDLHAQRKDLMTQFQDGEISEDDFQSKWDTFDEQISNAKAEIIAAERTTQATQNQIEQRWYADVDAYMKDHPDLGSETHIRGFDAELRAVTGTYPHLDNAAAIQLAHTRYAQAAEAMRKPLSSLPPGAHEPAQRREPEPAPQRRERDPLPPTLNQVPGSDMGGAQDGRFAQVERAIDSDPFAGEQAFERMSPEDQMRFLAET